MKVLITGATGAIGRQLALLYAAKGHSLVLHGRDVQKLEGLAGECRQQGVDVQVYCFDLADSAELQRCIETHLLKGLPDIVIANAGMNINIGKDLGGEDWSQVQQLIDLNIRSTMQLGHHMALAMKARGGGQLVFVSSLAGNFGLPMTPSYCASKAALTSYGESLRGWLVDYGVGVTVVTPGYIQSKMCSGMPGPKPFMMSPEKAALLISNGIAKNYAKVSFPFPLNLGVWFLKVLPYPISLNLLGLLKFKK